VSPPWSRRKHINNAVNAEASDEDVRAYIYIFEYIPLFPPLCMPPSLCVCMHLHNHFFPAVISNEVGKRERLLGVRILPDSCSIYLKGTSFRLTKPEH